MNPLTQIEQMAARFAPVDLAAALSSLPDNERRALGARDGLLRAACALVLAVLLAGCATLAHGRSQVVRVESAPSGATVFVDDEPRGVTPLNVDLPRDGDVEVRLERDGFAPQVLPLRRSLSRWLWGDVVFSLNPFAAQGLSSAAHWPLLAAANLGWTLLVDLLSGGAYNLPEEVEATLTPLPEPAE